MGQAAAGGEERCGSRLNELRGDDEPQGNAPGVSRLSPAPRAPRPPGPAAEAAKLGQACPVPQLDTQRRWTVVRAGGATRSRHTGELKI